MPARFYNPGFKIDATLPFDHPTNDVKEMNLVAYWPIKAETASFFEVATEVTVPTADGAEATLSVNFAARIRQEYKSLAVIRIDPKAKGCGEDDNIAATDKEAKEKGDRLWREVQFELVREHQKNCAEIRQQGFVPKPARGNVAYAFKMLGVDDPANDIKDVVGRTQDASKVDKLEEQIAELRELLLKKASA